MSSETKRTIARRIQRDDLALVICALEGRARESHPKIGALYVPVIAQLEDVLTFLDKTPRLQHVTLRAERRAR